MKGIKLKMNVAYCNIKELDRVGSMIVKSVDDDEIKFRCLCGNIKSYKRKYNADIVKVDRDCGCGIDSDITAEKLQWMKNKKFGSYIVDDIVTFGSSIFAKVSVGDTHNILMTPHEIVAESIKNGGVERETLYVGLRVDRVTIYDMYSNQYGRMIVRYRCDCGNTGECDASAIYRKLKNGGHMSCDRCKEGLGLTPEKASRLWSRIKNEECNSGVMNNINDMYIWLHNQGFKEGKILRLKDNKQGYKLDNLEVVDRETIENTVEMDGDIRANSVIYNLETGSISLNSLLKKYGLESKRYRISRSESVKANDFRLSIYDMVEIGKGTWRAATAVGMLDKVEKLDIARECMNNEVSKIAVYEFIKNTGCSKEEAIEKIRKYGNYGEYKKAKMG